MKQFSDLQRFTAFDRLPQLFHLYRLFLLYLRMRVTVLTRILDILRKSRLRLACSTV